MIHRGAPLDIIASSTADVPSNGPGPSQEPPLGVARDPAGPRLSTSLARPTGPVRPKRGRPFKLSPLRVSGRSLAAQSRTLVPRADGSGGRSRRRDAIYARADTVSYRSSAPADAASRRHRPALPLPAMPSAAALPVWPGAHRRRDRRRRPVAMPPMRRASLRVPGTVSPPAPASDVRCFLWRGRSRARAATTASVGSAGGFRPAVDRRPVSSGLAVALQISDSHRND